MARLGVVGLGNIGGAVAANLVADGHEVTVTDLDPERVAGVAGARPAASTGEVAAAAEVTFTSLPTPAAVAAVAGEWAAAAAPGSVLVDLSTTDPAGNQAIAADIAGRGLHFVEAPLTGGALGARRRSLVFMIGGDPEPVARVVPLLDGLGRATFHLGPVGTGTTMKLANSLLAFACTWASLEALALAVAGGVDVRRAVEVVRTGGATNFFVDHGVEGIDRRGRPADFALALAAKDAHLVADLAAGHGVSATIAAAVVEALDDAVSRGLGDHDWSDLVVAAEQRSGVRLTLAGEGEG
jgi:3-hydroxyisobutyrate dehydrogenase-like beta-hydroxyacid dehydrogenase